MFRTSLIVMASVSLSFVACPNPAPNVGAILIQPADGETMPTRDIRFSWQGTETADEVFLMIDREINTSSLLSPIAFNIELEEREAPYEWFVLARYGNQVVESIERNEFTVRLTDCGRPSVPQRGQAICATESLEWTMCPDASRYTLTLERFVNGNWVNVATGFTGTGEPFDLTPATFSLINFTGTILPDGLYRWNVTPTILRFDPLTLLEEEIVRPASDWSTMIIGTDITPQVFEPLPNSITCRTGITLDIQFDPPEFFPGPVDIVVESLDAQGLNSFFQNVEGWPPRIDLGAPGLYQVQVDLSDSACGDLVVPIGPFRAVNTNNPANLRLNSAPCIPLGDSAFAQFEPPPGLNYELWMVCSNEAITPTEVTPGIWQATPTDTGTCRFRATYPDLNCVSQSQEVSDSFSVLFSCG